MFREKDGEDLRSELGLAPERANELVDIVQNIMNQEAPDGGYGRTSHVLLTIAGRKDLSDVEKIVCVFLFSCKAFNVEMNMKTGIMTGTDKDKGKISRHPEIQMPRFPFPLPFPISIASGLKTKEFIDIEEGSSGMMIAPEGIGPEHAIAPLMAVLISMLRQLPKKDAQEFSRNASLSFARIAMTGDVKL